MTVPTALQAGRAFAPSLGIAVAVVLAVPVAPARGEDGLTQGENAQPAAPASGPTSVPVETPASSPGAESQAAASDDFGLLGDLWGVRRSLADHGIDFAAELTLDNAWNTRGGLETGFVFMPFLDLELALRSKPLLGFDGGRFTISMISYGQSRDPDALVPNFWGWSDLISGQGSVTQLAELWYEQALFDKRLRVRFGKLDANDLFANVFENDSFINSERPGT